MIMVIKMSKTIIVGEIKSRDIFVFLTPVQRFKKAYEIAKIDDFIIETNDAMMIETIEVLCGEKNIQVYLKIDGKLKEIGVIDAYNYIGDLYDVVDHMRAKRILDREITDSWFERQCEKYIKEWNGDVE